MFRWLRSKPQPPDFEVWLERCASGRRGRYDHFRLKCCPRSYAVDLSHFSIRKPRQSDTELRRTLACWIPKSSRVKTQCSQKNDLIFSDINVAQTVDKNRPRCYQKSHRHINPHIDFCYFCCRPDLPTREACTKHNISRCKEGCRGIST